jgi:ribosomal protein S18 acetylase RimI-like enzyme
MNGDKLRFDTGTCTEEDIRTHLLACDGQFQPRLSERVDIDAYARKLALHAVKLEAWNDTVLVGLVAAYVAAAGDSCYVTDVSVLPAFGRSGIARALLAKLIAHPACGGCSTILLEVSRRSVHAQRLYARLGFRLVEDRGDRVLLRYARTSEDAIRDKG